MGARERRRKLITGAVVVAVCFGAVVVRAVWDGRAALSTGDAALAAGNTDEAVRWWRRAARWYVPGAPHVDSAYQRLQTLATQAEARSDVATALAAWRGIRSSILATRSLWTPHEELLEPANQRIAALMATLEGPSADPQASEVERAAWHYRLLARDESPAVGWVVVALIGFAAWIGGAIAFALRAVTADDELVVSTAVRCGVVIAAGLFIWVLGLYNA